MAENEEKDLSPAANEPPATEESVAEEPATEEPAAEEPVTEEPATEEPATEEPAAEEPVTEEPATEEPVVEEPVAEEPATEEPVAEEPATEEPVVEEPVAEEPVAEEAAVAQSAAMPATAPAAKKSGTSVWEKMFPPGEKLVLGHLAFNVLAVVIAIICGCSILLAPIVTLDMGKVISSLMDTAEEVAGEIVGDQNSGDRNGSGEGTGSASNEDALAQSLGSAVKGVANALSGVKLSVGVMTLWKASNEGKPIQSLAINLFEENKKAIEKAALTVTAGTLVSVVSEDYISSLPEEEQAAKKEALARIDYDRLTNAVMALDGTDPKDKDEQIGRVMKTFTEELGAVYEITPENEAELKKEISKYYDNGVTKEGKFNLEQMICTTVVRLADKESQEVVTDYIGLLEWALNNLMGENGGAEFPAEGVNGALSDAESMMSTALKGVSIFFFVIAGLWFLLAALALIHIFLPNKRFATWYAIVFGGSPASIWVMLTVGGMLMKGLLEKIGMGSLVGMFTAISSGMWVCALCYLAIIVMSIVMAPYHKKMKIREEAKKIAKEMQ